MEEGSFGEADVFTSVHALDFELEYLLDCRVCQRTVIHGWHLDCHLKHYVVCNYLSNSVELRKFY